MPVNDDDDGTLYGWTHECGEHYPFEPTYRVSARHMWLLRYPMFDIKTLILMSVHEVRYDEMKIIVNKK